MDWYYDNEIRIKKLEVPPYDNNCYIIACPQNNEAVILDAPGHTPGSSCFLFGRHLFSGDTLFPGGPGNTPNPTAFRQIITNLVEKIFVLDDDTYVYPGHGDNTLLGKEKREFASFTERTHDRNLCGDVLWLSS